MRPVGKNRIYFFIILWQHGNVRILEEKVALILWFYFVLVMHITCSSEMRLRTFCAVIPVVVRFEYVMITFECLEVVSSAIRWDKSWLPKFVSMTGCYDSRFWDVCTFWGWPVVLTGGHMRYSHWLEYSVPVVFMVYASMVSILSFLALPVYPC